MADQAERKNRWTNTPLMLRVERRVNHRVPEDPRVGRWFNSRAGNRMLSPSRFRRLAEPESGGRISHAFAASYLMRS